MRNSEPLQASTVGLKGVEPVSCITESYFNGPVNKSQARGDDKLQQTTRVEHSLPLSKDYDKIFSSAITIELYYLHYSNVVNAVSLISEVIL